MYLNDLEKIILLRISRLTIEAELSNKPTPSLTDNHAKIFNEEFNVDVTIWVSGFLRGSKIVFKTPLIDGVIQASQNVCKDERFAFITEKELAKLRIQIFIWKNEFNLINQTDIEKNKIDFKNGYMLCYKEKKEVFLPAAFNIIKIKTLSDIKKKLAVDKMGYLEDQYLEMESLFSFYSFEVENFIEGLDWGEPVTMSGPIIIKSKRKKTDTESATLAAEWLLKNQDKKGAYVSTLKRTHIKVESHQDPRTTFTAWGLAVFGIKTKQDKFTESSKRYFQYAANELLNKASFTDEEVLSLTYLGQLALTLGEKEVAKLCAKKIKYFMTLININKITQQQIASYFIAISNITDDEKYLETATHLALTLHETMLLEFRKNGYITMVFYLELTNVYFLLYEKLSLDLYKKYAEELLLLILNHQKEDGSFTINKFNDYTYTRLVGKTIEILSNFKDPMWTISFKCMKSYNQAISWLKELQYDEENTFFIDNVTQNNFIGGFRHDEGNYEVWIDSVGHFLLAHSRNL